MFSKKKTLYYPGCWNKFMLKDIANNYIKILKRLGIDFVLSKKGICCGSFALNLGYQKDFEKIREKNINFFKESNISKIITPCPTCYYFFLKHYPIEVQHITQLFAKNLDKFEEIYNEEISYHDPCYLGRYSNIYEEPRNILKKIGFKIIEPEETREKAMCCGHGTLKINYPKTANKIAELNLKKNKSKKIVTTCPRCYLHFKENTKNKEILELSEVLK